MKLLNKELAQISYTSPLTKSSYGSLVLLTRCPLQKFFVLMKLFYFSHNLIT